MIRRACGGSVFLTFKVDYTIDYANICYMNKSIPSTPHTPAEAELASQPAEPSTPAARLFATALRHMQNVANRLASAGISDALEEEYLWAERLLQLALKVVNCEHKDRKLDFEIARMAARTNSGQSSSASAVHPEEKQSASVSRPTVPASSDRSTSGGSLLDSALAEARVQKPELARPAGARPHPVSGAILPPASVTLKALATAPR